MAKKAKARKKPAPKKGGEMAQIEAALNYAGIPSQSPDGKTIDSVAGRVILAMTMLRAGTVATPGAVVLDPHNPAAVLEAEGSDESLRAQAEEKTAED